MTGFAFAVQIDEVRLAYLFNDSTICCFLYISHTIHITTKAARRAEKQRQRGSASGGQKTKRGLIVILVYPCVSDWNRIRCADRRGDK